MTFEELRAEAQKAYKEVLAADEERKNDKTIARLSELYVESYVNEKRRERDAAFREYVISCVEELRELVSSVITEKRNGLDKMLSTPPTSEQLSLLTALQVRGEDISEGELRNLADQFMPNYQAVKALQTISKKNGVHFALPEKCDYEALQAALNWTENYMSERLCGLRNFTAPRNLHAFDRLFFGEGWRDPHYDSHAVNLFD